MKVSKFVMLGALAVVMSQIVGCGRIEQGNVGVRTNWNKSIESVELNPGFFWAVMTDVDEYVGKEIEVQMNDLTPKAKDNLSLQELDVSVFYKINTAQVAEQRIKYQGMSPRGDADGFYYPGFNLVERNTRGAIYDIVGNKYESLTIHNKRNELEDDVMQRIQSDLDAGDKDVYTITRVIVRQVTTDKSLEESIRASVRVQKQIEAKNQEIQLAQAEAKRLKEEALGEAQANEIIANSITPNLIKLREIEMQAKFAKEGTHTVLMGAATPLVNVK